MDEGQSWGEALGGAGGGEAQHNPAMALTALRDKRVLGCIQSTVNSRAGRGFCPYAVLRSHLQLWNSSIRRIWSCWSKSRGGQEDDARAGALLLYRLWEQGLWSAWSRGGSFETLQDFPVPEGSILMRLMGRVSQDMSNPICSLLDRNLS